jgi:hypothetical protein
LQQQSSQQQQQQSSQPHQQQSSQTQQQQSSQTHQQQSSQPHQQSQQQSLQTHQQQSSQPQQQQQSRPLDHDLGLTYQFRPRYDQIQIDPIKLYPNQVNTNLDILSQINLLENDVHNIFSNNITPERIDRLGSGVINNGQNYDTGSLNPKHLMMSEYPKPEGLVQNNISKNTYAETLQEYTIIVDSADRDINKYPNPFSYRVFFNPVSGSKDASISRKFNYVKYIKLDTGILPTKYYYIKQDTILNLSLIHI